MSQTLHSQPSSETPMAILKTWEYNLSLRDDPSVYIPHIKKFVNDNGIQIAACMADALKTRANKVRALTLREADTLYRSGTGNASSDFFWEAMIDFECVVTEGHVFCEDNPWELRASWNRGLLFMKSRFQDASDELKAKAKERIAYIDSELKKIGLPMYKIEREGGFNEMFLRPEYMTASQYAAKMALCASRTKESDLNF